MNPHTLVKIHKALAALWFLLAVGTTICSNGRSRSERGRRGDVNDVEA
jgi:hypothetical protein